MKRPLHLRIFFAIGLFIIVLITSANFVLAQDSGSSFTITPPIFELKANPGDHLSEVVSVFNNGNADITIATTIENLEPMGEKGQVRVTGNSEEGLPGLKDWIKVSGGTFNLAKGATENVTFDVMVPGNAEPGGHFATVLFGTTNSQKDSATGSTISQKIGTLVLLTVAGQAKEEAHVLTFSADRKLYWKNQTINFTARIENQGNVYVRPRGFLVITDIFGRKISQTEIDGKNILPGAIRQIPIEFQANRLFGPHTATLVLVYGNTNQNLNVSTGFTIIPWLATLIVIVLLALIVIFRKRLWKALLILIGRK